MATYLVSAPERLTKSEHYLVEKSRAKNLRGGHSEPAEFVTRGQLGFCNGSSAIKIRDAK